MFGNWKTKYKLGAYVSNCDLSKQLGEKSLSFYIKLYQNTRFSSSRSAYFHEDHRRLASLFGEMQTHPAYPTVEGFQK